MQQQNNQEEKQSINLESSSNPQTKQDNSKDLTNKYITSKCKWITCSVTFILLSGIGIFLGIYLSQNTSSAPTLKKYQRDEFQQVDEICLYQTSNKILNCTQIKMETKRVVKDVNERNASSLLMLKKLKVTTYQQNTDGTREYNEMLDENTEIEQQIKKSLRILQEIQSKGNSNLCEGIPQDECGDVNEVPLVTVITDQQTGAVQSIGLPSGVSDLILQPLVSNIIHIAPNVEESNLANESSGTRLLNEHYSNLYYVGKQAFVPKSSKTKSWFGRTVIKKKISQSDQVEGDLYGINLFEKFEQIQETNLDNNNYLVSSHITTNSKLSNSVSSNDVNQNTDDLTQKSETEITSDSDLVTVETKSDEDITNVLSEIQNKQNIQYYSVQDLQDKIQNQQNGNEDINQNQNQIQDQVENQQEGNRILQNENGDVQSSPETSFESQLGECLSSKFNQKRTLKEVTVLKQRIGLQAEFQGTLTEGKISGSLKSCVSLNGKCKADIYKKEFSYQGQSIETMKKQNSQASRIFDTYILILGYPLKVGANYNYAYGFTESIIKSNSEIGISENIYVTLSITAYGELNIIYLIKIRAGVEGHIFKGNVNGVAQFQINKLNKVAISNKYLIFLDFQIEALTFDVYAQYQHITLKWEKKCIGRSWWKICFRYPKISFSNWKDIYRKRYNLSNLQVKKRIYELKSKCY